MRATSIAGAGALVALIGSLTKMSTSGDENTFWEGLSRFDIGIALLVVAAVALTALSERDPAGPRALSVAAVATGMTALGAWLWIPIEGKFEDVAFGQILVLLGLIVVAGATASVLVVRTALDGPPAQPAPTGIALAGTALAFVGTLLEYFKAPDFLDETYSIWELFSRMDIALAILLAANAAVLLTDLLRPNRALAAAALVYSGLLLGAALFLPVEAKFEDAGIGLWLIIIGAAVALGALVARVLSASDRGTPVAS